MDKQLSRIDMLGISSMGYLRYDLYYKLRALADKGARGGWVVLFNFSFSFTWGSIVYYRYFNLVASICLYNISNASVFWNYRDSNPPASIIGRLTRTKFKNPNRKP